MATHSPQDSIRTYGCKWSWCRSTFSDNAELVHHVIHAHARRTIPVRRRDLPLLRRAEEGTGESLEFSYAFTSQSFSSDHARKPSEMATEENSQDVASYPYGASSSLPSPPASSLAGFSPIPSSLALPPETPLSKTIQRINVKNFEELLHTPHKPLDEMENTFASLSSPAGSASSFAVGDVPNSPTFSSLVDRSVKRRFVPNPPKIPVARASRISQNRPLSQSTNSSTGSHILVEQHLTQSPETDDDEEINGEEYANVTHKALQRGRNAYTSERQLESKHSESPPLDPQTQKFSQGSQFQPANYDLLSQAPSQFQMDSFPYHYHGAKAEAEALVSSQNVPQSTSPLQLSSPAPLHSPTYATSTPHRQNWYQPPHLVNHSASQTAERRGRDEDEALHTSTSSQRRPSEERLGPGSSPSKSKRFKSGTLNVPPPVHVPDSKVEERGQGKKHWMDASEDVYTVQSQSSSDSSVSEDFSYPPLQTQAPYQSQSWSQF